MTASRRAGPAPAGAPNALGEVLDLLAGDPLEVCPRLLGAVLRAQDPEGAVAVRLTEVEAYRGEEDPGSHAFRGRTARNATMFEAAGAVYVYFTYGMHHCANIVCGPEGLPPPRPRGRTPPTRTIRPHPGAPARGGGDRHRRRRIRRRIRWGPPRA